jgi:hypothetical protein
MVRVSGYHISGDTGSISAALVTRFHHAEPDRHLAAGGVADMDGKEYQLRVPGILVRPPYAPQPSRLVASAQKRCTVRLSSKGR